MTYWPAALAAAAERKARGEHPVFTLEDKSRAHGWKQCACGELDNVARDAEGAPKDPVLLDLGATFSEAVSAGDVVLAARMLDRIQERASELMSRAT